jgi:Protein of unknown function (DUF4254)
MFEELPPAVIIAFHDAQHAIPGWGSTVPVRHAEGVWRWIEVNHRCNCLLWDEEDLARRRDVPDTAIAANKRAIDGYNQKRNDAIERIDEWILARLSAVPIATGAWHSSETAGSIIDRMSIVSLKIFHMRKQIERVDSTPAHIALCANKLEQLVLQREDLAHCLFTLLEAARHGTAFYRIYRQFKMYNDPTLNPYLYGRQQ